MFTGYLALKIILVVGFLIVRIAMKAGSNSKKANTMNPPPNSYNPQGTYQQQNPYPPQNQQQDPYQPQNQQQDPYDQQNPFQQNAPEQNPFANPSFPSANSTQTHVRSAASFGTQHTRNYFCRYCGMKYLSQEALNDAYCSRNPDGGKHALYQGAEKSQYFCKNCGIQYSSIAAMTSGMCSKSPEGPAKGRHEPAL